MKALDKNQQQILFQNSPVTLECHHTTDLATMLELQEKALPVVAQAFADEVKDFLLDENFQVKAAYAFLSDDQKTSEEPSDENPFIASARLSREERIEFSRHQWQEWFESTARLMENIPFNYYFVMAKDNKEQVLGFTAFYTSPMLTTFFPDFDAYTNGDVVLEPIAIIPSAQGLGLARSLVFSILTLAPETQRILVGTRIWITNALTMYEKLGFTEYKRDGIGVQFQYIVKQI